jgi:uncharacterized protein (DUF305 family)
VDRGLHTVRVKTIAGRNRRFVFLVVVALAALVLAGCGSSPPSRDSEIVDNPVTDPTRTAPAGPGHNDIDVDFAQMMVVHHRQAVDMAALATDHTTNPAVLGLAQSISTAQASEIDTLTAKLQEWGEDVPDEIPMEDMDMSEMDHEGIGMGFMMGSVNADQIAKLAAKEGQAFDVAFLKLMRTHHGGAISMAYSEGINGENEELVELAQTIQDDQMAEVDQIQELLQSLHT